MDVFCVAGNDQQAEQSNHLAEGQTPIINKLSIPAHPTGPGPGRSAEPHPFPEPRSLVLVPSARAKHHTHGCAVDSKQEVPSG
eukprot:1148064-Pelagomonas_calceolata.AAC.5